ncbi:MAG TPA: efflux RND transporter periplasmic adaptor subunit [Terriglobales bacterium]|nr:efflux RND transporter periplasmic adaptor subunit [Terriglobales bacterium]
MQARRIAILLIVILVIGVAYYFITTGSNKGLVLIGTVDANQVIVSANIQGRIEKLLVDEGTDVKAGDPIAVIDSTELTAEKQAAEATLISLRSKLAQSQSMMQSTSGTTSSAVVNAQAMVQSTTAQLAEAQANLERQKLDTKRAIDLADQGVASVQSRDLAVASLKQAQAQVDSLQKQVDAAKAQLKSAEAATHQANAAQSDVASARAQAQSAAAQIAQIEARLGYTRVFAPVTGTVSVRAAREGEVVSPSQPIVTVVDYNDTWVRAAIPETYNDRVAVGDTLPVILPSGEKTNGKVIFKSVEADFATQRDVSRRKRDIKTVGLKLKVDNAQRKLVPGLTAEVIIPDQPAGNKVAENK